MTAASTGVTRIAVASFAHPHAESYVSILRDEPGVELVTSDPGPHADPGARGADLAARLGVAYVDSIDELLAWRPHGVIVTSENAGHRALVEAAAGVGAHILCEKPLATSREDALAIRSAVERAGVTLTVAYPVRFAPAFVRLRAEHDRGALGRILAVRGSNNGKLPSDRSWFTDPDQAGGGALMDHVVHLADLLDALMGAQAVSVTAVANTVLHADRARAETAGLVTIAYDSGVIAAIDCSWSVPDTAATWGGLDLTVTATGGVVEIAPFRPHVGGIRTASGEAVELHYGPSLDYPLLANFLDSVRTGRPHEPDVEAGIRSLEIVLAAQQSARTGTTVAVAAT
jgi:1,5-anhydro-D-fructose reductase (1,5-anhydro-D-mannitol-forming)